MALLEERALGIGDALQREGRSDEGADLGALDVADEVREHGLVPSGAADEREVLEVKRAHIERHDRPADRTRRGVAAAATQNLKHRAEVRPGDVVDDEVDRLLTEQGNGISIAVDHPLGAERAHGVGLQGRRDRGHPRTAATRELHGGGADAARGAGHQHMLPRHRPGAVQHVLGGGVGAGDAGELRIGPVAAHLEHLGGRHLHELGEGAVEVRAHPDVVHRAEALRAHAGAHQHPAANEHGIDIRRRRHDPTAAVGALDEREGCRDVPAAVGLVGGTLFFGRCGGVGRRGDRRGVPAETRVDLGVVHARREHTQQHLAGPDRRDRHIAPRETVEAAVAGGDHGLHGRRLVLCRLLHRIVVSR